MGVIVGTRGPVRTGMAALGAVALLVGMALVGAPAASAADPTASMSIQKAASDQAVTPGQTFSYTIQFQCTAGTVNGCVNAELDDPMPSHITIVGDPQVTGTANFDAGTSTATELIMTFTDDLGSGQVGLAPGNVVVVQLPVRVDDDAPPTEDGTTLDNTATITADNATTKQSSADVVLHVPSTLDASTTKSIDPAGGPNVVGTETTASLTGTNNSNVPVAQLIISDPVLDSEGNPPPDAVNPFTFLEVNRLTGDITWPDGADTVQARVFDSTTGEWVLGPAVDNPGNPTFPASVAPADITGVQLIFTSTGDPEIRPGATGGVSVVLDQKTEVPDDELPRTITNVANTTVIDDDGNSATSDPASATYRIPPNDVAVSAGKTFDPGTVHAGDPSTVTLTGTNESEDPLDSLTITEPAPNTVNHLADGQLAFTQMGTSGGDPTDPATSGIVWPDDATAATVTYSCSGTPGDPQRTTTPNTLPAPPASCDPVSGFTVTFDGPINPGGRATIPFVVTTTTTQPLDDWVRTNTVLVAGELNGNTGTAGHVAVIRTIRDRIRVEVGKTLIPSTVPSYPGQIVTAELSGQLLPFPDSTVDASTIVVQDPAEFPDPTGWYDAFDPRSVTATPVPGCSTLTVQYTTDPNGADDSWQDVPGMEAVHGATIFNGTIPADVGAAAEGIRFVYAADPAGGGCSGGFPPGTSVSPNLSFALDEDAPNDRLDPIQDCAASSGTAPSAPDAQAGPACDQIEFTPVNAGGIDPIDKAWDSDLVTARSQADVGATLSWSTDGFTGGGRVVITDTRNPDTTVIADSVFDTFDLVRIDPITPDLDPLLTYDQITKVELFELPDGSTDPADGTWVDPATDPCPDSCDGMFPGYTLTGPERDSTIGFRLTYIESPTRADRLGTPGAPPVGSGVAASTGNNRKIHPEFELRDVRRSDPDTPVTADQIYNAADDGVVNNTVRLDPYVNVDDTSPIVTRTDEDTIQLVDVPVTVDGTKTWDGGPLGIPAPGVPQSDYPTGRITVTATNTTPAKVDELTISDPDTSNEGSGSCLTSPFNTFNLVGFTTITPPGDIGASGVSIHLTPGPGGKTDYSRDEALALTEAQLVDVTAMTITYAGRIDATSPTATVTFDVRLRTEGRSGGGAPVPGSVCNQVHVEAADMVGFPGFTQAADAFRDAPIDLVPQGIDVIAGKSFDPTSITEPSHGPVAVTLSGQPTAPTTPGGSTPPSRAVQLVLEDSASTSAATFFNAYDFDGFSPITFVTPVNQVTVDAFVGGTWSVVGGDPVLTGGHWELGTTPVVAPDTTLSLPTGVTAAQVQGLRFTFTRTDGANWENPADPRQTVTFSVLRRDTLNTGGPVPSDLAGSHPAPGEDVAGDATNTTTATVTSSDVDANGDPLTASDDADATVRYHHATNAVQIRKDPNGQTESPGTPFPYTMTVRNTGDVDITNPVITDVFPADAVGPQIQLSADPNFRFTFTGSSGMPTDPADVTIDASDTGLVFTFPDGSTLPIGETYTIQFVAVTRPGLAADTQFTNTVGVTGDRPWDACDNGGSNTVEQDGQCRTAATNTVTSAGAIAVVKQVKAEGSDVLGVVVDPLSGRVNPDCTANADGFYLRPCIPIGEPGGDVTWRMHFVNTGNLPLDRILGIDRLPAPGDAVATAPDLPRGSEWQPLLRGARPAMANAQDGEYHAYYTTSTSGWCDGPQARDGFLLCDASDPDLATGGLEWHEWPAGQTLSDLGVDPADVTGLQVEFLPVGNLAAAGSFDVDVPMVAPAFSPADTPNTTASTGVDTFAFNTVGTAARIVTGGGPAAEGEVGIDAVGDPYTLTTEPPRVGVALAHGGLRLEKTVDGDAAAQFAPDEFPVTLSCTSAGEDVPLPDDVANQTLTPGTPVTVFDLPYHAACSLTEGDNGQTSSNAPVTATVERDVADFPTAALTNTYDFASLAITKAVDSAAADQDGNPIPYGPFTVRVVCTFLGDRVFADGFGPLHPMVADLSDGETVTFTGLPAGAECTITETDDKGAQSTTIVTTAGSQDPETTDGTAAPIVLEPDADGGTNTAEITNTFGSGPLHLLKVVTGDVADIYGAGPFTLSVSCVLDDESGTRTVWEGTVTLGRNDPLDATIDDIALGAACTVSETDDGGASTVTVDPTEPVIIGNGETSDTEATVTATNSFDPAKLLVDKVVDGDAAAYAQDSYPIEVTCTANDAVLPGFPVTVDVTPGTPAEVDTLVGAKCSAVETDTGQATEVTYDPPATDGTAGSGPVLATADSEDPTTITVTNTYRAGELQILKDLSGPGAAIAKGPFVFDVSCAFNGDDAAFSDTVTLERTSAADTLTSDPITGLPVGAVCTVTETDSGGADSTPAPVTVTIPDVDSSGAAQIVVASLVNPFSAGTLQLTKVLAGEGASAHAADAFTVAVTCQLEVGGDRLPVYSGSVMLRGGQTVTISGPTGDPVLLPNGTHCWAAETDAKGAEATAVDFDSYDNAAVVAAGEDLQTLMITVTNTFAAPPTTPTTPTSPAAPTTPTGPAAPSTLPNTGAPITLQLGWTLVLLAAGGALLATANLRRQRGRHR